MQICLEGTQQGCYSVLDYSHLSPIDVQPDLDLVRVSAMRKCTEGSVCFQPLFKRDGRNPRLGIEMNYSFNCCLLDTEYKNKMAIVPFLPPA